MNSINEDEEGGGEEMTVQSVDQFPSVRPPSKFSNNNICSSKQSTSDHTKYQITNRSTSLPSRQTYSSNQNIKDNVRQRRRHVSDSNNNNKTLTTSLVTSFIQYLRCELRATANDQKHDHSRIHKNKSVENINYLSQTFDLSNNFYRQKYPIRMSTTSSSVDLDSNSDENEISKLINLLILRVECLTNENTLIEKNIDYPTIKQIDENLIEYLYYLFNKFVHEESDVQSSSSMIDKTNFVNVCQTLVRNGCFNLPTSNSPDQSLSESTMTNSSDQILPQTFVHEYRSETDDVSLKQSSLTNDQETWLVVDLEPIKPKYSTKNPEQSKCLLPSSTSDDQYLLPNENYFSFEEIKSYESESSQSNYYSPDSSLIDIQNMVQDLDEINNINNNNNTLFNEDGSSPPPPPANNANVINENFETTNKNSICTGLVNDEHVASSSMESTDTISTKQNEKISRRERKMQERWTTSTKTDPEQLPPKTFLGVEFTPIAVLRKKFSSLPSNTPTVTNPIPIKKKDPPPNKTKTFNPSKPMIRQSPDQEINPSIINKIKHEQVLDLQTNGTSSLNDIQPSLTNPSELLTNEKNVQGDMTMTATTIKHRNHFDLSIDSEILNSPSSSLLSISSSASPSSSSPTSTTNTNENKTIEFLLKEIEEEKKEEEVYCGDGDNVDREKKNNCNVEHASGTLLINGEPTQLVLLEQEKKEEQEIERTSSPSSPLSPSEEPCGQSQTKDEPSRTNLTNNILDMTMTNIDQNEQRYKTIEIEEIPDEDDDLSIHNNPSIEPTDCILTDDELITSSKQSRTKNKTTSELDTVLSCYEQALSKTVDTIDSSTKDEQIPKRNQRPEDDPIALRALQRFQERMNAAAAATTKNTTDETNPSAPKGKSSWSGTLSTPRKSVENLFKANQQSQITSASNTDELSSQRDTFIRPRKTFHDDGGGLNFGMTLNLFGTVQNGSINQTDDHDDDDDNHHKLEEQHQPTAIVAEDDNKQNDEPIAVITTTTTTKATPNMIDTEDAQPPININSSTTTNESSFNSEADNSNSLPAPSVDSASTNSSLNTVISCSSTDQQSLTPYRLQLEGRRRLNTLERIRERRQNQQSNDAPQPPSMPPPMPPLQQQQLQFQNEYTLKPEDLQDPIIRRALERFDEKSRSLAQTKTANYDDIQDPITRRALMRLDSNLKRTIPSNPAPPLTNNDSNETWYTNSYTLGSLQSNNDPRFLRYPESSLPPTSNHKPSHVSIHQRFCSTSSAELADFSGNNNLANNDQNIPVIRVPTQPVYVTSNNQPQTGFRQRSRSEDMLSSRELIIGQTTNLDDSTESAPLERNHSSDDLQHEDVSFSNEPDSSLPNPVLNTLDPNFVHSSEAPISYATPNQAYSAYSSEYTRSHLTQSITSPKLSPRNLQQENEIQSSSAFLPVHPSANNYYPPAQLPPPSYNSMYTSNNFNPATYSDDPIVRRALERFNCQMQNSLMTMSHHQPSNNYMSRQYTNGYPPRQGSFDTFQHLDPQWNNGNRSMAPPPPPLQPAPSTSTGYQSIIGRRRQMRNDDSFHDHTSVGNGYSSSLFINSQNSYPYMNYSDEPPAIPPRLHRDLYHEQQQQMQQEYLCENLNNNNNNGYIQHVYPGGTMNGYHPVNHQFIPGDYYQQIQDEEYLRHRAQSTSSNTSSDSVNQIRLMQQRLAPTSTRPNYPTNKALSPDHLQIASGQTTPSTGSTTGDSVFHRLAYTATKSSLSKSSSNLCANLVSKPPPQQQQQQLTKSNTLKAHEIDYDESTATNPDQNSDSISAPTTTSTKCQRSRSVDGRARLKNAQTRLNTSTRSTNEYDDHTSSSAVPSSKFTSANPRRSDAPPPRIPTTPRSINSDRTPASRRALNGSNLSSAKNSNGVRARGSNGNLIDAEHEENGIFNDNYQPKIVDNKPRTAIPVHRYPTTNNHIQTSASASAVHTTHCTRVPIPASANLDRRDSNTSGSDLTRLTKRSDENRLLSPTGQRRTIPVSVFAPAKHPASNPPPPSSTSPTNESNVTYNSEPQLEQSEQPIPSYSSQISTDIDDSCPNFNNDIELSSKLSSTNSALKSSSGNLLNELSMSNDKHDSNKKMNVFERLFRGHKKKV